MARRAGLAQPDQPVWRLALLLAGGQPLLLPWGQPPTSLEALNVAKLWPIW